MFSAGCAALLRYIDSSRLFSTGLNLFETMSRNRGSAQQRLETVAAVAVEARVFDLRSSLRRTLSRGVGLLSEGSTNSNRLSVSIWRSIFRGSPSL